MQPQAPCSDCKINTNTIHEYYTVHDHVWLKAGGKRAGRLGGGYLCIGCLETRLERKLEANDFPFIPVNDPRFMPDKFPKSTRLLNRLNR